MASAFVYFIDDGLGNVKIGKARSVNNRKNQGQTWSAGELKELGRIECSSEKQAFLLEALFHTHFDNLRINPDREWFKKNKELSQFIDSYKDKHFNELQELVYGILETSVDVKKYAWIHTLTKEIIEKAYVHEIEYFQNHVELYGEFNRAEIRAMTVYV